MTIREAVLKTGDIPVMVLLGTVSLFLVGFVNLLDLQVGKEEVGLDTQVLLKLACSGLLGVYGFCGLYSLPKMREILFTTPGLWFVGVIGMYFIVVPTAVSPTYALASALVLFLVVLGTVTACVHLGLRNTLVTLFMALTAYNIGSWFVYFFVPSIGVFQEATTGGRFAVRMGGLAHPNTLGQLSAFTVILGVGLYQKRWLRSKLVLAVVASAVLALYMSYSRTSLIATVAGLVVAYRHLFFSKRAVCLLFDRRRDYGRDDYDIAGRY